MPKICAGLEDSPHRAELDTILDHLSCGRTLTDEPYWYYHRLRHVGRCRDCQHVEWVANGYEIDQYGMPSPGDNSGSF